MWYSHPGWAVFYTLHTLSYSLSLYFQELRLHRAVTQCWWEYKLYKKWAYWITWLHCSEWPIILSKQLLLVLLCDQKYMVTMTTMSMLYHIATAYQIQVPTTTTGYSLKMKNYIIHPNKAYKDTRKVKLHMETKHSNINCNQLKKCHPFGTKYKIW